MEQKRVIWDLQFRRVLSRGGAVIVLLVHFTFDRRQSFHVVTSTSNVGYGGVVLTGFARGFYSRSRSYP